MRTTLTLDDDVFEKAKALAARRGSSLSSVVTDALRAGLTLTEEPQRAKPFQTPSRDMGLRPGFSLDCIAELLTQVEGEDYR